MERSVSKDIKMDIRKTFAVPSGSHKLENMEPPAIKVEVLENGKHDDESGGEDVPTPTDLKIEIGEVNLVKQESLNEDDLLVDDDDDEDEEDMPTHMDFPDDKMGNNPPSGAGKYGASYKLKLGSKTFTITKEIQDEISDSAIEKCLSVIAPSKSYGLRERSARESFRCATCRQYFSSQSNLEKHSAKNSCKSLSQVADRRYVCPRCQQVFAQSGNLKMHLIGTHFNMIWVTSVQLVRRNSAKGIP